MKDLNDYVILPNVMCLQVCARAVSSIHGLRVIDITSDFQMLVTKKVALILGATHFTETDIPYAVFPDNCGWYRKDINTIDGALLLKKSGVDTRPKLMG